MMLAIEPNVARPKTAVKRRGGGHTTHKVSHCLHFIHTVFQMLMNANNQATKNSHNCVSKERAP